MKLIRSMSKRSNSELEVNGASASRASTPSLKQLRRGPVDLLSISLDDLAKIVSEDVSDPDTSHVMRYGQMLLELGLGSRQKPKIPRLIYHGTLLMEWAAQHDYPMSTALDRMLGYAHSETWLSNSAHSERYLLSRAKELYENVLLNLDQAKDPTIWLEYSQVLLFQGNFELGAHTSALIASKFADTPNAPIYLLNAAAMYLAGGNFDLAGKNLFQSIQTGPPKFFTKSEMLLMLSRIFEQSGTLDDSRAEDGYFMVYQDLADEELDGSPSYEEWLNRSATWTRIADKCVMYGLYSLAADLYGQALVRDTAAFRSSKVWFRYSKSCYRCGKLSDAQLAVKQAIVLDPDNVTCQKTLEAWSSHSEVIRNLVHGPLEGILNIINEASLQRPRSSENGEKDSTVKQAARMQVFFTGAVSRVVGPDAPLEARLDVAEGKIARAAIVARLSVDGGRKQMHHHMLVQAKVHFASGAVRSVKIFDMKTTRTVIVKLKSPFIVPFVEYRDTMGLGDDVNVDENQLEVVLSHDNVPATERSRPSPPLMGQEIVIPSGVPGNAISKEQLDDLLKRIEKFDLTIRCEHVSSLRLHAGSAPGSPDSPSAVKDVVLVHLRFVHRKSGKFSMRQISLNFDDGGGLAVGEAKRDLFGDLKKTSSRAASPEYDKIPRSIIATPPSRDKPLAERHHTPSMLSPVKESLNSPDRLADQIGHAETPLAGPVTDHTADIHHDDSKSCLTDSQGDFQSQIEDATSAYDESNSYNDESSYNSEHSSVSGYSSSSSYTYTTGSYSYDDYPSAGVYSEDDDEAPNPRGTFRFLDMLYMFRAYHPGEEAALGVSYETGTRLMEGQPSKQPKAVLSGLMTLMQSMAIHVLQVPTNRLFIFVLPPEEMPHQRLIHQMVFFLLSVAKEVSETALAFDSELDTSSLPLDDGNVAEWGKLAGKATTDMAESRIWNISGSTPSRQVVAITPSAASRATMTAHRRAQTVRQRTLRGVKVLGRHVLVSCHSPHPGVVRIYVVDPLMRSIIPPRMRSYDDEITEYSIESRSVGSKSRISLGTKSSKGLISDWNDGNVLTDDKSEVVPPSPSMTFVKSDSNKGSWTRSQPGSTDECDSSGNKESPEALPSRVITARSSKISYDDSMSTASSYIYQDDQSSYDTYSSSSYTDSQSASLTESLDSRVSYSDSLTGVSGSQSYSSYSESGTSYTDSIIALQQTTNRDSQSHSGSMTSSVLSPSIVDTKQSTGRGGPGDISHAGYHEPGGLDGEPSEITFNDETLDSSMDESSILSDPTRDDEEETPSGIHSKSLSVRSLLNEVIPEGDEDDTSQNLSETESESEQKQVAPGVYRVVYGESDSSTGLGGTIASKARGSLNSVEENQDDEASVASSVSYFSHEMMPEDDSSSKIVNVDDDEDDDSLGGSSQWTRDSNSHNSKATSAIPEASSSLRQGSVSSYDSSTLASASYDASSYLDESDPMGSSYVTGSTSYVPGSGSQTDMSSSYLEASQTSYTTKTGSTRQSSSSYTTDPSSSYTTGPTTISNSKSDSKSDSGPGGSLDQKSLTSIEEEKPVVAVEETAEPGDCSKKQSTTLDEWITPIPEPEEDDRSLSRDASTFSLTLKDDDQSTICSMEGPETRRNSMLDGDLSTYSTADSHFVPEASNYSDASAFFPESLYDGSVSVVLEDSRTEYSDAMSLFPERSRMLSVAAAPSELFIEDTTYSQVDGYDYDADEQASARLTLEESSLCSIDASIVSTHSVFTWRDAKLAGETADEVVLRALAVVAAIPRPPPRSKEAEHACTAKTAKRRVKHSETQGRLSQDVEPIAPEESQLSVGSGSAFSGYYDDGDQSFDFGDQDDDISSQRRGSRVAASPKHGSFEAQQLTAAEDMLRHNEQALAAATTSLEAADLELKAANAEVLQAEAGVRTAQQELSVASKAAGADNNAALATTQSALSAARDRLVTAMSRQEIFKTKFENCLNHRQACMDERQKAVAERDARKTECKDSARAKSAKKQAMNFLAWQKKRLEAIDYISERVSSAVQFVTKRDAFNYLKRRVQMAQAEIQAQIDGPVEEHKPTSAVASDDEASVGSNNSKRSRLGRKSRASSRGSNVRFNDDSASLVGSPQVCAKPKRPPLRRASTLSATLVQTSLYPPRSALRPVAASDDEKASSKEAMRLLEEARLRAEAKRLAKAYELEKERVMREEEEKISKLSPTDALNDPVMLLKILTRRGESMPLSWTGQMEAVEAGKKKKAVKWEDGLTSGQVGGGPAKGKPVRLHHKTKPGKRIKMHTKSPVDFLDDPAYDSAVVFDKSIGDYCRVGYSAGSCEYLQVWNAKIKMALDKFRTVAQLNRAVEMLRKNVGKEFSNDLSRAEALVGLGGAAGSPAEALGILRDNLFREEALNICRSMPLKEVARVLEDACKHGVAAFGDDFNQSAMFTRSGRKIGMNDNEAVDRAKNKKIRDAELCEKFKEVAHKILDSGLSSEVIHHIAQLQGESDPSASFFASSSFVAPAPEPVEPMSGTWRRKTPDEILSPDMSTSHYETRTDESNILPDIRSSQQLMDRHPQLPRVQTLSSVNTSRRASRIRDDDSASTGSGSTASTRYRNELAAMSQSLNLQRHQDTNESAYWVNSTTGMSTDNRRSASNKQSQSSQPPGSIRVGRTIQMMTKGPGSLRSPTRAGFCDEIVSSRDVYKARQKELLSLSPSYGVFKKQQELNKFK